MTTAAQPEPTAPGAAPTLSNVSVTEGPFDTRAMVEFLKENIKETIVRNVGPNDDPATPFIILPMGKKIESLKPLLDSYRDSPAAAVGFASMHTAQSFIDHTNRHKVAAASVIFANAKRSRLVAIYDYHQELTNGQGSTGWPDWCRHGSTYACPLSDQWERWVSQAAEGYVSGVQFAEFLEENIADIVSDPVESATLKGLVELLGGSFGSATQLRDLSRNLQINASVQVRQAQNLSSGEVNIAYSEQHADGEGQPIKVPTLFAIGIPVYRGGKMYQIPMRLRYRLAGGKVVWAYMLHNPDAALEAAFNGVVDEVKSGTELPVFLGDPDNTIVVPSADDEE